MEQPVFMHSITVRLEICAGNFIYNQLPSERGKENITQ
jgi:hypothetical protein